MLTEYEQEQLDAIKRIYYSEKPLYLHYNKDDKIYASSYPSWWSQTAVAEMTARSFGGRNVEQVLKEDPEELIMYFEHVFRQKKYYNGVLG